MGIIIENEDLILNLLRQAFHSQGSSIKSYIFFYLHNDVYASGTAVRDHIPIKEIYFRWEANHIYLTQNGIAIPVPFKFFRV